MEKHVAQTKGFILPGQSMWDLWWTKWHWDRFFPPSSSVFPCQFHSTGASLLGKGQKLIIIIFTFITGLHNKPHGCSASVASAAGPFTTKKKKEFIPCWRADLWNIYKH
jgi:hypothetical protein